MIRNLYYYLVLFATLMMSIGGSVGVFMSVADYVSPSSYYQSFSDYKMMQTKDPSNQTIVTDDQLKKSYDELVVAEKQRIKDNALNGIIKSVGWIVIPLPIFFYFQRQIKRKEQ